MTNLVPIGRFSAICRLSQKALRLYDELGLLRPAWVDPDSGYRYYALAQALEAERIRFLRALEVPLEEIAELLRDPTARPRILDRHRRRLQERVAELQALLASLAHHAAEEDAMTRYEVRTKELSPQQIVGIRMPSSVADISRDAQGAYGELFGHLARAGARPAGPAFSIYHAEPGENGELDVEFCVPVDRPMSGAGRIAGRELPGGRAVSTLHAGAYDTIGPAYAALQGWIQAHGHECLGPPRELYLVGPDQARAPAELRTELQWPIR